MKKIMPVLILFCLLNVFYVACSQGFVPLSQGLAINASTAGQTFPPSSGSSTGSSTSGSSDTSATPQPITGNNKSAIVVGCGYMNEPCVSVTICKPGTSTCQTIDNVLLDTGSYGLRLFSSVVTLPLANIVDSSSHNFAECVTYVDGASDWGPIVSADVQLGDETAPGVPIQMINSQLRKPP